MNIITKLITIIFATLSMSAYGQVTAVVMSKGSDLTSQGYFSSGSNGSLQKIEIENNWNYDKYITSAGYTSNGWFLSMSKGVKWTNQGYKQSSSWPDDYVHEQKEKGYMITSLASSNSSWLVVTSYGTGFTDQQICAAPWSSLGSWVSGWWDKGYYITSIACQNSLWTIVMSKGSSIKYTMQAYFGATSTSELEKKIKEKWDEGYRITALEYGDGSYLCVMSQYPGSSSDMQSYNINNNFEKWVKGKWDEGYKITYIGG